jgi:hypothetical protein
LVVGIPRPANLFFFEQDDGAHARTMRWFFAEARSSATRRSVSQ